MKEDTPAEKAAQEAANRKAGISTNPEKPLDYTKPEDETEKEATEGGGIGIGLGGNAPSDPEELSNLKWDPVTGKSIEGEAIESGEKQDPDPEPI